MGPFNVSLIQLFVLAIGVAGMLGVMNVLIKSGFSKVIAILFSLPILLIFAVIAFFKMSEMGIIAFAVKFIRTHFLDTVEKFQVNFPKMDEIKVLLLRSRQEEKQDEIVQKDVEMKAELLEKMQVGGLV